MKLFKRYNRINLLSTVVIFLLASTAFAFLLQYVLVHQVDEDLEIKKHEILLYAEKYEKLPEPLTVEDQQIHYELSAKPLDKEEEVYSTKKSYDEIEKETNDFRQLVFNTAVKDRWFIVTIAKSLEGTEAITRTIILITVLTILLILLISLLINRLILRKLWKPFYGTLEYINGFKLGQNKKTQLPISKVDEFNFMNSTLEQFLYKADEDYKLLKEFTENASHELQTPIAVIRSKLDVLVQDEDLSEKQSVVVQSAYDALQKLSRLNQSLLLLSKIENRQFAETDELDFESMVQQKLEQFHELFQVKELTVNKFLQPSIIKANKELADILLNNLFSNAIQHTQPGGTIIITLTKDQFTIANSATGSALDETRLFSRFYKSDQSSGNHGLGLSIVKQICDVTGFRIHYGFQKAQHIISLLF